MEENTRTKLRSVRAPFWQVIHRTALHVPVISDINGKRQGQRPSHHGDVRVTSGKMSPSNICDLWNCQPYNCNDGKTKPVVQWISPMTSSTVGRNAVPFIQQEPAIKPWRKSSLCFFVFLLVLMTLTCVSVTGILWAVWSTNIHKSSENSDTEQTTTTQIHPNLKGIDVSSKLCATADGLVRQTRRQCGGIRHLTDNQTDTATVTSQCRVIRYETRCLLFSLWYTDDPCPLVDIRRAVLWRSEQPPKSLQADDSGCSGLHTVLDLERLLGDPDSCQNNDTLYKMARRDCPAMVSSIEGFGVREHTMCRNLEWLFHCMRSSLRDNQVECPGTISSNYTELAAVLFPYLTNNTLSRCSGSSTYPPCTGYLTEHETRVFVGCSAVLSLQSTSNSSITHCKIYAYMARCVQRGLAQIGTSCSLRNIISRLETDLSGVPEVNPDHIKQCINFIEDYDEDDICHEEDVLDMVAHSFCTKPESQPFRITQTNIAMSPLFSQCSNFSAAVTCVSEHLTSVAIPCHPTQLETVMGRTWCMLGGTGSEFNVSQCNDDPHERLCSDGQSILQITGDTCNIVLSFIQQQHDIKYRCSYFRQFVACVQVLLQSRGYECFFNPLQRTLTQEHPWFLHRSGFDSSYCTDLPSE